MARASFAGKVAVVTGGGSGIGRALGAALAAGGARVVLADVDEPAVTAAAAALGPGVTARVLDVRDLDAGRALVDDVVAGEGGLDLFFANAGISMGGVTDELTAAHWDHIIDVNLRGAVNAVLAAYPVMRARGSGHLVLTASGAGLAAPPFVVPYATTKHAVVGLGTGLRPEAALRGVKVSVLCPGAVETPILDRGPAAGLPATATMTARQYMATVRQRPMPADRFAAAALRQVARNRRVIAVPRSAGLLWRLSVLSPGAVDRITLALARRVDRGLAATGAPGQAADRG